MIDIHCHLLPAVDDGARDIRESIALLRIAAREGIREMVLTPHIHSGRWDNSLQMLRPRFEAFERLVRSKDIDVQLHLGAEVHLLVESLTMVERGQVPFVGRWQDEPAMLVELHDGRVPPFALNAIRHLRKLGVRPIIVHPERNKDVMADPARLQPLVDEGCLFQLTAGSITGHFGRPAEQAADALLERGWVDFVATDAHNLAHRPPRMKLARHRIAMRYGEALADQLTRTGPAMLVACHARADAAATCAA
jgi:protein-tyrosine phosphatase